MPENMIGQALTDTVSFGDGGSQAFGSVAQRLLQSGFSANSLRTNAVLRKDEWKHFDEALIQVARQRLRAAADLITRGLTYNLQNPLGTTQLEWERISDIGPAQINMSAITDAERDRPLFDLKSLPIPIVHKDFQINIRVLEASRKRGEPLDTTGVELATRKVAEAIENLIFNGGYTVGTEGTIYGYTNAPDRNTGSVTAAWASATGAQIIGDVLNMINMAQADHMYGPYVIYVPAPVYVHMGDDYKAESDRTILERVLAIPGIASVMPSDTLTGENVLMIQMSRDVVDLVVGMQPTVVQWESYGGLQQNFKVMAIMVPRVKSDYLGQSGIVHFN